MNRTVATLAVLLMAALALSCLPEPETRASLIIVGATLIDGNGGEPVPDSVIVIQGDRIVAAGPQSETPFPKGSETLDARGKWIIPGLIDSHVHFFQSGGLYTRPDVIDLRETVPYEDEIRTVGEQLQPTFRRYLCSGVTSVADVGGPMWNFVVRGQAAVIAEAPRVAVAGPLVSTYVPEALKVDDPPIVLTSSEEESRALVARLAEKQPDLVKIWFIRLPGAPLEELLKVVEPAIEESHARGIRVAVHATQLETAKAALRAGADVLVHSVADKEVDAEFIRLLKESGAIYTSSMVVFEGYEKVLSGNPFTSDFDIACGDPSVIDSWNQLPPEKARSGRGGDQTAIAKKNLKTLQDAGVVLAAGTDAGNIGTLHGPAIHREFELMAEAGLTPMEILVAATRNAARVLSAEPEMGTLEAGKFADLVILDADPLENIRNARKISKVIKGGKVFDHSALVNQE